MNTLLKYNPAIDGLRAVSVLAVFVFHLNKNWMPGGFLGVDIFFTISGYLITTILYRERLSSTFSYGNFYRRRINRILPAYFLVLSVTMVAAYLLVLPYDFYKFGISVISSIFFISNFNYAARSGDYFSNNAEQWPLLHTWSLSVEEQFYIFWPLVLVLLFYLRSKFEKSHAVTLLVVFAALIAVSAALGTFMAMRPDAAKWSYYLFVTRANELMIGAALAVAVIEYKDLRVHPMISNLAMVGLLLCLVLFNREMLFPGFSALLPCTLAALVIAPSRGSAAHKLLSVKALVAIGLLSYSIYLWHWPTIALSKYVLDFGGPTDFAFSPLGVAAVVAFTLLMSTLSYHWVEKPVRRMKNSFAHSFVYVFLLPGVLLSGLGAWVLYTKGMPQRFLSDQLDPRLAFYHIDKSKCPSFVSLGCQGNAADVPHPSERYLLVGNSHAEHYYQMVSALGTALGVQVDLASAGACYPHVKTEKCERVRAYVFGHLSDYDGILYAQKWTPRYFRENRVGVAAMDDFFAKLRAADKPVAVLGRIHGYLASADKVFNYHRLTDSSDAPLTMEIDDSYLEANVLLRDYASTEQLRFIDVEALLKEIGKRVRASDEHGRPNYLDTHHLSVYGGEWIARTLLANYPHSYLKALFFPVRQAPALQSADLGS